MVPKIGKFIEAQNRSLQGLGERKDVELVFMGTQLMGVVKFGVTKVLEMDGGDG